MENLVSAVRTLIDDLKQGSTRCFEVQEGDLEGEGGGFSLYDEDIEGEEEDGDGDNCDVKKPLVSSSATAEEVFEAAYRELQGSSRKEQQKHEEEERGQSADPASDSNCATAGRGVRRRRLVKRFNTRSIMWLSNYAHSNHATSHLLDRMWSTAKK
jgi:hypothetical protein